MVLLLTVLLATLRLTLGQSDVAANVTEGPLTFVTSPPKYPSPWAEGLGDWTEAYAKARAFVSQLTLLEKVNLTTGVGWEGEKCVGNTGSFDQDIPRFHTSTRLPRAVFAGLSPRYPLRRLRFCLSCWRDNRCYLVPRIVLPPGLCNGLRTSSQGHWEVVLVDNNLQQRIPTDSFPDVQLGPAIGPLGRTAAGGRNWEGFAPDPSLTGIAVHETVKGIQDAGVIACTKHYIVNEQEHFRQGGGNLTASISSNLDDVTMHELYLWPFADAVRAGTGAIMCSYNQVNNSYACQNSYLQNYLLKNELGFQGMILSDWAAQHSGVSSALAGLDMTMPGDVQFDSTTSYWGPNLTIAVLNGTVPQWRLDDMAVRIVAAWYYVDRPGNEVDNAPSFSSWSQDTFGFEHAYAQEAFTQINYHVDVQGGHAKDIREFAAKGTVLLKNTGALPLTGKERLTAVFGSDAAESQYGPNGCSDRGCDNGTLAMGWGSGTANFPYLITPLEAIKAEVRSNGQSIESVIDDFAYPQITALARRVPDVNGVCLVFANSDAGEGYIIVDGNEGDRNNLTLWHNGDTLIQNVTSQCNNTVVVLHSVGEVDVTSFYEHPNITAIVWAGIPGQESGNAITDILYGKVNPGGKSPFSWAANRSDYGTDVLYEPNNGNDAPQDDFNEGIFIDYRALDKHNKTPIYEFGFGLSYTTFEFSNQQVQVQSPESYEAPTGTTPAAPTFGSISNNTEEVVVPANFSRIYAYIYPYLNSTSLEDSSGDPEYGIDYEWPGGAYDSSPQPYLPAGGAPGGNPALWDVLFNVTATITNNGTVVGDEVPQLYISLGGPNDAKVVLRDFDRLTVEPGQSVTFEGHITRRDLSNWDPVSQNWVISDYPKKVYVGQSSRKLLLEADLDLGGALHY